ncbi:hypothetical protein CHX26_04270 [Porphyrobacter sp. HT-58-2]|uniref:hypothetical protein n=1 Tax=Porphyrobacter sp. HT-58-2 TaxID=2023229 RepID=UPI000CDC893B|nr:hypothetical protein [Porphyrobacter sp. HT-58-2]AUX68828.1 hypothetical protein CHX26_04270 [Porphyrobacter sp. HT-58-2]
MGGLAKTGLSGLALLALAVTAGATSNGEEVDPLVAVVELDDADRFATLFAETEGAPDAAQIQKRYLDPAGRAVAIFTPNRIRDADHLAAAIAGDPAAYRDAITRCLPWVRGTEPDLRAIYLAYRGLLPELPLPRVAMVFGAGNSGGTAQADMQVLGLEVLCRRTPDEATFRRVMRDFYAHETAHTFQRLDRKRLEADPLLAGAIAEGTADYLALLVTGEVPDPARNRWAEARADFVWAEFARDIEKARDPALGEAQRYGVFRRWVGNAGNAPEGWPDELGYWVGMKIAAGYVANAKDRRAAIRELLRFDDPRAVLAQSGIVLPTPSPAD